MEIQQLRYFQAVAQEESITRVARQLYISQPALSASISRLEKDLGIKLFERSSNRILLTEAGKVFLEHVNSSFAILTEGVQEAKRISGQGPSRIVIATAFGILRGYVKMYLEQKPNFEVELVSCEREKLKELVLSGKADAGVSLGEIPDSRLGNQTVMEGRFFATFSTSHPLAGRPAITLQELTDVPLFCSSLGGTKELLERMIKRAGRSFDIIPLDEREVLFQAAEKGLGAVLCMPLYNEHAQQPKNIRFVPILDLTERGHVTIVTRRNRSYHPEEEQFLSFIGRRFFQNDLMLRQELERLGIGPQGPSCAASSFEGLFGGPAEQ